jgi:recombination protein RecA
VKVVKNKVAPPFREAKFDILYGEGTSRESELIELGVEHNMIDKAGAWYSYQGTRIGQGKENVRQYLKENPTIANTLEKALREKLLSAVHIKEALQANTEDVAEDALLEE